MQGNFKVGKVYFIVSDEDDKITKNLYQDIVEIRCGFKDIECEYVDINSREDLTRFFLLAKEEHLKTNRMPYFHLECHGNEEEILLKSGERVTWSELAEHLTTINISCRNNLFISMGVCFGAYLVTDLYTQIMNDEQQSKAPVYGLIGPQKSIGIGDLESGFTNYFDALLTYGDLALAIERLNKYSNDNPFGVNTCKNVFRQVIDKYLEDLTNSSFKNKIRFNAHIAEIATQFFQQTGKIATPLEYEKIANLLKNKEFYIEFFDEVRRNYFMIDLYPENEGRFPKVEDIVNWDDIVKDIG